jgi:hypothetical protein
MPVPPWESWAAFVVRLGCVKLLVPSQATPHQALLAKKQIANVEITRQIGVNYSVRGLATATVQALNPLPNQVNGFSMGTRPADFRHPEVGVVHFHPEQQDGAIRLSGLNIKEPAPRTGTCCHGWLADPPVRWVGLGETQVYTGIGRWALRIVAMRAVDIQIGSGTVSNGILDRIGPDR